VHATVHVRMYVRVRGYLQVSLSISLSLFLSRTPSCRILLEFFFPFFSHVLSLPAQLLALASFCLISLSLSFVHECAHARAFALVLSPSLSLPEALFRCAFLALSFSFTSALSRARARCLSFFRARSSSPSVSLLLFFLFCFVCVFPSLCRYIFLSFFTVGQTTPAQPSGGKRGVGLDLLLSNKREGKKERPSPSGKKCVNFSYHV